MATVMMMPMTLTMRDGRWLRSLVVFSFLSVSRSFFFNDSAEAILSPPPPPRALQSHFALVLTFRHWYRRPPCLSYLVEPTRSRPLRGA